VKIKKKKKGAKKKMKRDISIYIITPARCPVYSAFTNYIQYWCRL